MESEQETEELLRGHRSRTNSTAELEVLQMFQLVQDTYSPNEDPVQHTFDSTSLKKWHCSLFEDILPVTALHKYRTIGVRTDPIRLGIEGHVFPHHTVVTQAIELLSRTSYMLAKHIAQTTEQH